jgi:hypothetical protein
MEMYTYIVHEYSNCFYGSPLSIPFEKTVSLLRGRDYAIPANHQGVPLESSSVRYFNYTCQNGRLSSDGIGISSNQDYAPNPDLLFDLKASDSYFLFCDFFECVKLEYEFERVQAFFNNVIDKNLWGNYEDLELIAFNLDGDLAVCLQFFVRYKIFLFVMYRLCRYIDLIKHVKQTVSDTFMRKLYIYNLWLMVDTHISAWDYFRARVHAIPHDFALMEPMGEWVLVEGIPAIISIYPDMRFTVHEGHLPEITGLITYLPERGANSRPPETHAELIAHVLLYKLGPKQKARRRYPQMLTEAKESVAPAIRMSVVVFLLGNLRDSGAQVTSLRSRMDILGLLKISNHPED